MKHPLLKINIGRRERSATSGFDRIAIVVSCVAVLSAVTAVRAQFPPPCTTFEDSGLDGFTPVLATLSNQPGGPVPPVEPIVSTHYLQAVDQGGASSIHFPPAYFGDYCTLATGGCGALCYDINLTDDGLAGQHLANNLNPAEFSITNGSLTAVFVAYGVITEPSGLSPGWHHICAPIEMAPNSGPLPANSYGSWYMLPSIDQVTDAANFNTTLCNVTDAWVNVDFDSYQETVGYDNFCFQGGNRDHLKCYKLVDGIDHATQLAIHQATLALNTPQFGAETCKMSSKAMDLCVPACKTVIPGDPPLTPLAVQGQFLTNDQLCYKLSCKLSNAPQNFGVEDQFASRTVSATKADRICAPADKLPPAACGGTKAPQCDGACPPGQACTSWSGVCKGSSTPCYSNSDCPGFATCLLTESHNCACKDLGGPPVENCGGIAKAPLCLGACPNSRVCRNLGGTCQCTPF